jgi:hypothetical protein
MRDWWLALARRAAEGGGRSVAGGSWPGGQPSPPSSQPVTRTAPVDRSEPTMSKLARAVVLGATLAAMNLAAMTTVAQAQTTDDLDGKGARQPPTQGGLSRLWLTRSGRCGQAA